MILHITNRLNGSISVSLEVDEPTFNAKMEALNPIAHQVEACRRTAMQGDRPLEPITIKVTQVQTHREEKPARYSTNISVNPAPTQL